MAHPAEKPQVVKHPRLAPSTSDIKSPDDDVLRFQEEMQTDR